MKILPQTLSQLAKKRGSDFENTLLAAAAREDRWLVIPDEVWAAARRKYPVDGRPGGGLGDLVASVATPLQTVRNAAAAVGRVGVAWVKGDRIKLPPEEIAARRAICETCDAWDPSGYSGLGKCRRCGCSGFKIDLATERCPLGKWPELAPISAH